MNRIFFIDIQERVLARYVFEAKGGGYTVEDKKEFPLPDPFDIPADVSEKMETVYLSLPLGSLNFRVLDLPFSDTERIREVLPFELDGMILGGAERVIFDTVVIGKTDGAYQVLAIYIEKKRLRTILDKLNVHGIDPVCVTSLELGHVLQGFSPSKLVPLVSIPDDERMVLAGEEIKRPTVNLRRNEFSYTRDTEKTRKSLTMTVVLCAMIALILGAAVLYKIAVSGREIMLIKNEMRKSYLELFPGERNVMNELHQIKAHLRELRGREGVFIGMKPLDLLSDLASIEREGAVFYEMSMEKEKLTFRGEAGSFSEVQRLQEKLKKYFDEVAISDSKASVQGKTLFTITAKEKES